MFKLPVRLFNTKAPESHPDRPTTLVGWQDKAQLRSLSLEEKQRINGLQVEKGYRVTDFAL